MKKLICLFVMGLIPSGLALAAQDAQPIQSKSFFDPVSAKAENCQHLKTVKEVLSCEQSGDTNCASPHTGYGIPPLSGIIFQSTTTFMCSFQCVVGQERCDETLNPVQDSGVFGFIVKKPDFSVIDGNNKCSIEEGTDVSSEEMITEIDENGYKHIEIQNTYTYNSEHDFKDFEGGNDCKAWEACNLSNIYDSCIEWEYYVEICDENDKTNCTRINKSSEEWLAHQEQLQLKKYKESCFIPTEEDCSQIARERHQCMLDVVEFLNTTLCSSMDPIFFYRDWKEAMTEMKKSMDMAKEPGESILPKQQ